MSFEISLAKMGAIFSFQKLMRSKTWPARKIKKSQPGGRPFRFIGGARENLLELTPTVAWEYAVTWEQVRVDRKELANLYFGKKWSLRRLAKHFDCSRGFITRLVSELNGE